jgi:hypothetical protein
MNSIEIYGGFSSTICEHTLMMAFPHMAMFYGRGQNYTKNGN